MSPGATEAHVDEFDLEPGSSETPDGRMHFGAPDGRGPVAWAVQAFDDGVAGEPAPSGPVFVYAMGRVEPRFPSLAVEKEFAQATGRTDTNGLSDREATHATLAEPANRYLARQVCWVFTIEGLETYVLHPRDPMDLALLVETVRPSPRSTDVDAVIGVLGPLASAETCNGLMVPTVLFDQLYSFDVDSLIGAIPRPAEIAEERFASAAEEMFWRIQQLADNVGATDEDRALNYLVLRYPAIYSRAAESFGQGSSLVSVDVRLSRLSGTRKLMDVILCFVDRQTDVSDKYFVRVDVTEQFPFLVTKLSPYFDR